MADAASDPADDSIPCPHPTANVHYYYEITDEGREYEEYCCDLCNTWIPSGFMEEIRERKDWNGGYNAMSDTADESKSREMFREELKYRIDIAAETKYMRLPSGSEISAEATDCEMELWAKLQAAERDTRERCAQLAENFGHGDKLLQAIFGEPPTAREMAEAIAQAIRKGGE